MTEPNREAFETFMRTFTPVFSLARQPNGEYHSASTEWAAQIFEAGRRARLSTEVIPSQDVLKEMSACLERERTLVAEGITAVKHALDNRHWLTEGRGPYEWDDDNWHKEFAAAAHEIFEALKPLEKVARDFKFCPQTSEEVQAARAKVSPEAIERQKS